MDCFIGSVIKKFRILNNLSQSRLSNGICSVKQLSRIENNINSPTHYILWQLSSILEIDLYSYMPYSADANVYEIKRDFDLINNLISKRQYVNAYNYLINSKEITTSKCNTIIKEKKWILGILSSHVNNDFYVDPDYYIDILLHEYNITSLIDIFNFPLTQLDYKIINSIIVAYLNLKEFTYAALLLNKAISSYENKKNANKNLVYVKFLYNLSRLYLLDNHYNDAILYSEKGIEFLLKINSNCYLADLYNICGRAYFKLGKKSIGRQFLKNYVNLQHILRPSLDYESVIKTLTKKYQL